VSADEFLSPGEIEESLAAIASPGYAEQFDRLGVKVLRTVDGGVRVWVPEQARPHFRKLVIAALGSDQPETTTRGDRRTRRPPIPERILVAALRQLKIPPKPNVRATSRLTKEMGHRLTRQTVTRLRDEDMPRGLDLDESGELIRPVPPGYERVKEPDPETGTPRWMIYLPERR
jgi:hypothetical protein